MAVGAVPSSGAGAHMGAGGEGRGGGVLRWTINERMGVKLEVNNDL